MKCYVDWLIYKDPLHCQSKRFFREEHHDSPKYYIELPCKFAKGFILRTSYKFLTLKDFQNILSDKTLVEHFLKEMGLETGAIYCPKFEKTINEAIHGEKVIKAGRNKNNAPTAKTTTQSNDFDLLKEIAEINKNAIQTQTQNENKAKSQGEDSRILDFFFLVFLILLGILIFKITNC